MKPLYMILLAFALIAPLAGCNGNDDDDNDTNGDAGTRNQANGQTTDSGEPVWDWSSFAPVSYVVLNGSMGSIKRIVTRFKDDKVVTKLVLPSSGGEADAMTETYAINAEPWALDDERKEGVLGIQEPQARKIGEEQVTVPAGSFQTTVYEVTEQTPSGQRKMTYYTSPKVPGNVVKIVRVSPLRESEKDEIVLQEYEAK